MKAVLFKPLTALTLASELYKRVGDRVLGTDRKQRLLTGRFLAAAAIYLIYLVVLRVHVAFGFADEAAALAVSIFTVTGLTVFYVLLRSGWNRRAANPERLTLPQMNFAALSLVLGYAVVPAFRATSLSILAPMMVFGMFSLTPRQVRQLALSTLAAYALCMIVLATWRPTIYPPAQELIHFLILAAVLPTFAALTGQVARLRTRLREQRAALRDTLARLEQLVRHDALTGLFNRRAMQESLGPALDRACADGSPLCVCMIDLDHFKRVNDVFGHAAGDEVLRRFAELARSTLRGGDVLARWGGEEFLLLMPATAPSEAAAVMQRLRAGMADPAAWGEHPELRVTFSAGLAGWQAGEAAQAFVARADAAAYLAKADGRDRWVFAATGDQGAS